MMEIVVAAVAVGLEDRRSTHGETLIRSACEMLAQTSPDLVAALTLSLPASGPAEAGWLNASACSLAAQYEFDAAITVEERHVGVRLTRRQNHGGHR
jgi:hypothetical protein